MAGRSAIERSYEKFAIKSLNYLEKENVGPEQLGNYQTKGN